MPAWQLSLLEHLLLNHFLYYTSISNRFYDLLALSVGQRLCINFSVSRANFLTILRSHLDVTCSCYFGSSLFNVDVNYSYIYL